MVLIGRNYGNRACHAGLHMRNAVVFIGSGLIKLVGKFIPGIHIAAVEITVMVAIGAAGNGMHVVALVKPGDGGPLCDFKIRGRKRMILDNNLVRLRIIVGVGGAVAPGNIDDQAEWYDKK